MRRMRAMAAGLAAAGTLLFAATIALRAQTIGPGGVPIAPGPSQPGYTPGGIGPGGIAVAPGPAARGVQIQQMGPGGVPLAPGPAGEIQRQRPASVVPSTLGGSSTLATTIITDPDGRPHHARHGRGKRVKRRVVHSPHRHELQR